MNRRRIKYGLYTKMAVLAVCMGCTVAWLRAERRYTLDRQLVAALVSNNPKLTLELIDRGADPNAHYASPPPQWSLRAYWNRFWHRVPVTDQSPTAFLIASGARWGAGPEATAVHEVDAGIVLAMLTHGAHVNDICITDDADAGKTALHVSAEACRQEVIDALLEHGAAVNAQDYLGWTALDYAIDRDGDRNDDATRDGDMRMVRRLLEHGADPNLYSLAGENALYLAQRKQKSEISALLKQRGAVPIPPEPPDSVPIIAGLLGERVGVGGLIELARSFGNGGWITGPHPNSNWAWHTNTPPGTIYADDYNGCTEGNNMEFLEWKLAAGPDVGAPTVAKLPQKAGWLGDIYPGMAATEVARLTSKRLPPPEISGNTWRWTSTGFYRPCHAYDVYKKWIAELDFRDGILVNIYVRSDPRTVGVTA